MYALLNICTKCGHAVARARVLGIRKKFRCANSRGTSSSNNEGRGQKFADFEGMPGIKVWFATNDVKYVCLVVVELGTGCASHLFRNVVQLKPGARASVEWIVPRVDVSFRVSRSVVHKHCRVFWHHQVHVAIRACQPCCNCDTFLAGRLAALKVSSGFHNNQSPINLLPAVS